MSDKQIPYIRTAVLVMFGFLSYDAFAADTQPPAPTIVKEWHAPNVDSLPHDMHGELVRYGKSLTVETYAHLGPSVKDRKLRFAGNNLSCQSCHEAAATKPYALPWVGVTAKYPAYRSRDNSVGTIEDRVNECMERSMNGKALPSGSREMKAFAAYMQFLSAGIPIGSRVEGAGAAKFDAPDRKANPVVGKQIYLKQCASCHQANGAGLPNGTPSAGYALPPLWGKDSFNNGAGMSRLLTAASFIKGNMPLGTTAAKPTLTDEQAYDVAAYILSQPRPMMKNLERDFPLRYNKPVDAAYPPFVGGGTPDEHKFGPFQPLIENMKKLQPRS